jgi:hypothetical protein
MIKIQILCFVLKFLTMRGKNVTKILLEIQRNSKNLLCKNPAGFCCLGKTCLNPGIDIDKSYLREHNACLCEQTNYY